ncbi:MAG: septum formation initiator family protein [Actinomycetota bacterium]|nr:septum formation initiator family protein [Actinomycetota bacterium]
MSVHARADVNGRRPPRRRLAPRRNAGSPGASRIQWDRLGRVLFVLVIALLVILAVKPAINAFQNYRLVGHTKERLYAAQEENARLERQVKHVRGDAVLRREARRQGMIDSGEQAWVVNGVKP